MPRPLPKKPIGNDGLSRYLDALRELIEANQVLDGPQIKWSRTTRGVFPRLILQSSAGGSSATVKRFRVKSESNDYLTCREYDGTTEGSDNFLIAKPRSLRVSTWNDQTIGLWTYTGSATDRIATYAGPSISGGLQIGDRISETLDPSYTGSELMATEPEGGTSVSVDGTGLTWIDLNVDARRFVTARDRVDVCKIINGVQTARKLVIDGGPSFA